MLSLGCNSLGKKPLLPWPPTAFSPGAAAGMGFSTGPQGTAGKKGLLLSKLPRGLFHSRSLSNPLQRSCSCCPWCPCQPGHGAQAGTQRSLIPSQGEELSPGLLGWLGKLHGERKKSSRCLMQMCPTVAASSWPGWDDPGAG